MHEKWLITHCRARAQYRVSEAKGLALADVNARDALGDDIANRCQQVVFAATRQRPLEFRVGVEMILDRALRRTCDEHQLGRAGRDGFLHRVLDQRLVHDRQHLFRTCLGRWQEPGPSTRNRKYGCSDSFAHEALR